MLTIHLVHSFSWLLFGLSLEEWLGFTEDIALAI
jgi:hypothetical protein